MLPGQLRPRLSHDDIARIVAALGDLVPVLAGADPAKKAETYSQLGLTLKYRPAERTVQVAARPIGPMYVRKCPRGDRPHFPTSGDPEGSARHPGRRFSP
jgi:site-specific DNA recombinase